EVVAKKRHMTRSELMRSALRNYLEQVHREESQAEVALQSYDREKNAGKLKELKGSLTNLME
ncbi:MAG: ribbon-helix-helix protein, CopG family, partial [Nitrospinota bacterium]|nr:ribbon-helix-helix protein, CopG family [Nitrospinota bacterium]